MSVYGSKKEISTQMNPRQRKGVGLKKSPDRDTVQLSRMLRDSGVQAKLKIGQPNDRYEQEADRVAARVMVSPDSVRGTAPVAGGISPLTVQRAEEEEAQPKSLQRQEEEEEELQTKLQRQPVEEEEEEVVQPLQMQRQEEEEEMAQAKGEGLSFVPAQLSLQMSGLRGGGRRLPESERAFFEPRFGVDFSGVRVHDGGQAALVARSVRARAFTLGQDVVFGSGQYAPGSERGRKLLAHELTHVVQQKGGK